MLVLPSVTPGYKYELYLGDGEAVTRYGATNLPELVEAFDKVDIVPVPGYLSTIDQSYFEEYEQ